MQKYDEWAWNSGSLRRETKVANCIKGSTWVKNEDHLFYYRGLVMLTYWGVWLADSISQFK